MSQLQEQSPGSDDPDLIIAQRLDQVPSMVSSGIASTPQGLTDALQPVHHTIPDSQQAGMSFEIIVPVVDDPEAYEYLPGHFVAHRVLAVDMHEPKLIVRLRSGERKTMTVDQLKSLQNGRNALREFNEINCGSQSPDPLAKDHEIPSQVRHFGADGATDNDSDVNWGIARNRQRCGPPISYSHFFLSVDENEDEYEAEVTDRIYSNPHSASNEDSDDLDEISDDDDDDDFLIRPSTRRLLRRRAQKGRKRRDREFSEESHTSAIGQRKSSRLRHTHRRNMKEHLEDDGYPDRATERPRQQKFSGAREQFRELSEDDEFRLCHSRSCTQCGDEDDDHEKGIFVFCQGCTASYHQACLGNRAGRKHLVTKVDEGDFILQCSRCLGVKHQEHNARPHYGHCAVCREPGPMSHPLRETLSSQAEQQLREANNGIDPKTHVDMSRVNNVDNVMIRCLGPQGCKRAFHVQHLPHKPESHTALDPHWWQCLECCEYSITTNQINAVVAWRPKSLDADVVLGPVESVPEIDKEYLIKWAGKSYFHVDWISGDWVWSQASPAMLKAFFKSPKSKKPAMTTKEAVPEDNLRVDNIFEVEYQDEPQSQADRANAAMVKRAHVKFKGLPYEDSVWEAPPKKDETARWEDFQIALTDWVHRERIHAPRPDDLQSRLANLRKLEFDNSLLLNIQPQMVTGGTLMKYQLDGVNWLLYMFFKNRNTILADDMGLGKTIQIITLFSALIEKLGCFPFLVVVPNATVPNWRREVKSWAPEMRVVTYYGSALARRMANDYELFHKDGTLCCHVVIASYESMTDDEAKRVLGKVHWAGLVVDEGQRLKNDKTNLYERLRRMKFGFKVLLTGTPLQNNIRELFNLIQFIDPAKNAEQLENQYGGSLDGEAIRELHDMIRPCLLRRTKSEVLPFLPPMVQIIIPISMSVLQKKLYKSILQKNPLLIKAICKKSTGRLKAADRHNLNNIMMQLRKCLCHPYIYNRDIEEQTLDAQVSHRRLVEASGKLQLLNLMLPRLKERGHRALIFSQFLQNLDIVEDFLNGIGIQFCRLDGTMSSREKQHQIDEYNKPGSPFFAFLLSTRSGGVGINLATADTVIIMDPDFNPKQDIQALSRAHRIGQKNTVLVFHLVVRASVEEKIMQKGKTKMALDHVLIDRIEADQDDEDLESILKHGAQALFDDDDSADVVYDLPSIDKLLNRSEAEKTAIVSEGIPDPNEQTQFNFARVWQKDHDTLEDVAETQDDPADLTVWEKILQERERQAQEEASRQAEGLGRGKRKRGAPRYSTVIEAGDDDEVPSPARQSPAKMRKHKADLDQDFIQADDLQDEDSDFEPEMTVDMIDDTNAMNTTGVIDATNPPNLVPQVNAVHSPDSVPTMNAEPPSSLIRTMNGVPATNQLPPMNPVPVNPVDMDTREDAVTNTEMDEQLRARAFRHVDSPAPPSMPLMGTDGSQDDLLWCVVCQQSHSGQCPLRQAGVEFCGLCGVAHLGGRRVCPHLRSIPHVTRMLEALEKSTEEPGLIAAAKRYLRGIISSTAQAARSKAAESR